MSKALAVAVVILAASACGGSKPKSAPPTPPPAVDPEQADVQMFCSADTAAHLGGGLPELGPYVEPKLHETQLKKDLFGLRDNTFSLDQLHVRVLALTAQYHIEACPTLDKLFAPKGP